MFSKTLNARDNGGPTRSKMAYACQPCRKRMFKCDTTAPTCASCRESNLECIYKPPHRPNRKRMLSDDDFEKPARYENAPRQHGLLNLDTQPESRLRDIRESRMPVMFSVRDGRLMFQDRNSGLWKEVEEQQVEDESEGEVMTLTVTDTGLGFPCDPLTGALLGSTNVNLRRYHPTPTNAWLLWETHMESVEPLYKMLHTPTTSALVRGISQELVAGHRRDECLLFSIYHFAVFSMSEENCQSKLGQSRGTLLAHYHFAAKQALVNASFLQTTELSVLQALVLLLLASRDRYDVHTYWTLTGVAMRIGQRIGIHRDGEKLGLPPFEVEMRRRLFSQLLLLDNRASQMAGVETSPYSDIWDTQTPLNINDDQIWPGMTEKPKHQSGATDMMFCLSRLCLIASFVNTGMPEGAGLLVLGQSGSDFEAEQEVNELESEVEEDYIRYCDVIDPLHFLTVCMVRSGITAMRLRIRLPKVIDHIDPADEFTEALQLALKILDTDAAVCSHAGLEKYHWYTKAFFLWGTWDSLIFLLTVLLKTEAVFQDQVDALWKRVETMYRHHDDLFDSKRLLNVVLARLVVKAWEARPPREPGNGMGDPGFIIILRSAPNTELPSPEVHNEDNGDTSLNGEVPNESAPLSALESVPGPSQGGMSSRMSLAAPDIEGADWGFWDQLIKSHEARNDA